MDVYVVGWSNPTRSSGGDDGDSDDGGGGVRQNVLVGVEHHLGKWNHVTCSTVVDLQLVLAIIDCSDSRSNLGDRITGNSQT